MAQRTIYGVETKPLTVIPDERGRLTEILRSDEPMFKKFGQVYTTTAYPGVVKGWHYHKKQWDHFVVPVGMIKLVLADSREDSPTKGVLSEYFIGEHNNMMVSIPPMVVHGFKCISDKEATILNIASEPYDYESPDEFRIPAHEGPIPYDWARKDG